VRRTFNVSPRDLPRCQQPEHIVRDTRLRVYRSYTLHFTTGRLDGTQYGTMNYDGQLYAHHHQSLAPKAPHVNLAATHAKARRNTITMQKVQAHDDDTLGSGSSAAELGNDTDTFGREIMQHERDARWLQNATRGDAPLLKPRARPRISDLVARREREDISASEQQHIRTGSSGSNDSNPPLNVPREWGTRARSHRGWMRKIREPSMIEMDDSGHVENKGLLTPEEEDKPPRTSYGSDNIWNREDERAVVSENTPPSMKRPNASNAPNATIRNANSTLRHIIDSEDHEFSELSLLTSTPATTKPIRNGLARDNIEGAERYSTTNYRQDLLSERSPNRRSTLARKRENALDSYDQRTIPRRENVPRPSTSSYAEARIAHRSGLISNKENLPAEDTRDALSKASETVTISERTARAVTFKQQRPSHARNGSLHLLQRLATSLSPNSGKSSSEAVHSSENEPVARKEANATHRRATANGDMEPVQPILRRAHRKSSGSQAEETKPRVQSSSNAPVKPDRGQDSGPDETPAPRERPLEKKTPVVTGAWVDTPGQSRDSRPTLSSSHTAPAIDSNTSSKDVVLHDKSERDLASRNAHRVPYGDPNRPKSVLEEIVREARRDPTGTFGDATIQSLEDIVHPNTDPTDTTLASEIGGGYKDAVEDLDIGRSLTQAEKDRRQEDLAIEAMNKHLRAARTSIKDADRGLQRVENKWETTSHMEASQPATTTLKPKQATTLDRDWKTVCDHCGGSYHSLWWGLWTELRSVFYVYDKNARYGVRMTWLGLLVLTWLLWYILENFLCYHYCHPLYADFMKGYGVNPDAPRYPFVIPTLLFRPLRPIWRPALKWTETTTTAVFYTVFGEPAKPVRRIRPVVDSWDKLPIRQHASGAWSSTWAGRAATTAVAAAGRATRSFVDAIDAMGGETMNDDEYL
jgi:hypothetical protein